jgi:chromosome segregation ATPase
VPDNIFKRREVETKPSPAPTPALPKAVVEVPVAVAEIPQVVEEMPMPPEVILEEQAQPEIARVGQTDGTMRELAASLSRVTSECEKEKTERRRIEQRAVSLAAQLQSLHTELATHLETEQQNQQKIDQLEQELRENNQEMERLRGEVAQQSGDHQLAAEQSKVILELKQRLQNALSLLQESQQAFLTINQEIEGGLNALTQNDPGKKESFEAHPMASIINPAGRV